MNTHTAQQLIDAEPNHVLAVLTDPGACRRWAPIDFTTDQAFGERLQVGTRTKLSGRIAGQSVTFNVEILYSDVRGLTLQANGPLTLTAEYRLARTPSGTRVDARVSVTRQSGLTGALLARATDAVLAGGALRFALRRIAGEAERLRTGELLGQQQPKPRPTRGMTKAA